jgi:hypothetical protein
MRQVVIDEEGLESTSAQVTTLESATMNGSIENPPRATSSAPSSDSSAVRYRRRRRRSSSWAARRRSRADSGRARVARQRLEEGIRRRAEGELLRLELGERSRAPVHRARQGADSAFRIPATRSRQCPASRLRHVGPFATPRRRRRTGRRRRCGPSIAPPRTRPPNLRAKPKSTTKCCSGPATGCRSHSGGGVAVECERRRGAFRDRRARARHG